MQINADLTVLLIPKYRLQVAEVVFFCLKCTKTERIRTASLQEIQRERRWDLTRNLVTMSPPCLLVNCHELIYIVIISAIQLFRLFLVKVMEKDQTWHPVESNSRLNTMLYHVDPS